MSNFWDKLSAGLDLGTFGILLKNGGDLARLASLAKGGMSSFFGKRGSPDTADNKPKDAEENVMQEGEFLAIIGILSAFKMTELPHDFITEYQPPVTEMHLFNKVIAAMKPGARKLFMSTTGFRGGNMKRLKVVDYVRHTVNGKMREDPITEETNLTVNMDGRRINSAIVYLAKQGSEDESTRVKKVAAMLEGYGIFKSITDTAAELGAKSTNELERFLGWLDTHAHVFGALLVLWPGRLQTFMDTPACDRVLNRIMEDDNPDRRRPLQEEFQRMLVGESTRVNNQRKIRTLKHWYWTLWLFGGSFVVGVVGVTAVIIYTTYFS